jgi:hypothetical protein
MNATVCSSLSATKSGGSASDAWREGIARNACVAKQLLYFVLRIYFDPLWPMIRTHAGFHVVLMHGVCETYVLVYGHVEGSLQYSSSLSHLPRYLIRRCTPCIIQLSLPVFLHGSAISSLPLASPKSLAPFKLCSPLPRENPASRRGGTFTQTHPPRLFCRSGWCS